MLCLAFREDIHGSGASRLKRGCKACAWHRRCLMYEGTPGPRLATTTGRASRCDVGPSMNRIKLVRTCWRQSLRMAPRLGHTTRKLGRSPQTMASSLEWHVPATAGSTHCRPAHSDFRVRLYQETHATCVPDSVTPAGFLAEVRKGKVCLLNQ